MFKSRSRNVSLTTGQMREYQRNRAHQRIALARERLGGACARCGADEDLDFDHVDPGTKVRNVSAATNWSLERFVAEVDKCQLLCRACHIAKSIENGDLHRVDHGGGARGRRGCKCDPCRERSNAYSRELKARKKTETG